MASVRPPGSADLSAPPSAALDEHRTGVWTVAADHRAEIRQLDEVALRERMRAIAGLLLGSAVLATVSVGLGHPLWVGGICVVFGFLGLYARQGDERTISETKEVKALREDFGVGLVWPIDLMIRQGETVTGRDRGLLWIEGGRILFSGLRTSFAIAPEQADGSVYQAMSARGLKHRLNLPLKAQTRAGKVSLSLWPLSDGVRRTQNDAAAMTYALNTIVTGKSWSETPRLVGQWPPLEIGPGALSPHSSFRLLYGRVVLWGGGIVAHSIPVAIHLPLCGLLEFVVLAFFAIALNRSDFVQRRKAYRDCRRAWQEE